MGYLEKYEKLYDILRDSGFELVFKPVVNGKETKGNCDIELALQAAAIDINDYNKAIIISGDGDFYSLIKYLKSKDKFKMLIAPSKHSCSNLLRRITKRDIVFATDIRNKIS